MWIFDEEKDMTNAEVLQFAQESNGSVVYEFPAHVLNNKSNMLTLIENGYGFNALKYCSKELKQDMEFLKEAAQMYHYTEQVEFFSHLHPAMQNSRELLGIFAAKVDDLLVKNSANIMAKLEKMLPPKQVKPRI